MLPPSEPEERMSQSDRGILILVGVLIFGFFIADLLDGFHRLKAGALFLLLATLALTALHEAAHAFVGARLGWRICRVVIGVGPRVTGFRVGSVPVELRRYPVGGFVVPAPTTLEGARLKSALIYAAGPGSELFVVLLIAAWVGPTQLLSGSEDLVLLALQATSAAAVFGAFVNLLPFRTEEGYVTDGLGILTSSRLGSHVFLGRMALLYTVPAETLLLAGRVSEARETLERGVAALPDNLPARVVLCESLLEAGQPERVVALLSPLVERDDIPTALQPAILCALATALVRADKARLSDADAYTEHALDLTPDDPECALARGYVLTELGQYHQARKLFEDLKGESFDRALKDARDAYVALLEFRCGRSDEARSMVKRLRERGARGAALEEVRAALR